jgi:hypothetical protein
MPLTWSNEYVSNRRQPNDAGGSGPGPVIVAIVIVAVLWGSRSATRCLNESGRPGTAVAPGLHNARDYTDVIARRRKQKRAWQAYGKAHGGYFQTQGDQS